MNTPKPCDTCDNLYSDCMSEDNPFYETECKLNFELGNINCPHYKKYKSYYEMENRKRDLKMNNIHEKCNGCERIDENGNCLVYIKPTIWWRDDNKYKEYCPLATHFIKEGIKVERKRVGQQKQKKQKR